MGDRGLKALTNELSEVIIAVMRLVFLLSFFLCCSACGERLMMPTDTGPFPLPPFYRAVDEDDI